MLCAQLSSRKSLRDLVFSLNQHVKKLYHLGQSAVKRSTLTEANELRPAIIFEKVYHKLLHRLYGEMTRGVTFGRSSVLKNALRPRPITKFLYSISVPDTDALHSGLFRMTILESLA
ncbi:MAG: DUF4372 domain-containing protein [Deltaproteobacteria bacterium]|nr:DUF4372 domain-containing protein [Deltaproteobacteria bacterium]